MAYGQKKSLKNNELNSCFSGV